MEGGREGWRGRGGGEVVEGGRRERKGRCGCVWRCQEDEKDVAVVVVVVGRERERDREPCTHPFVSSNTTQTRNERKITIQPKEYVPAVSGAAPAASAALGVTSGREREVNGTTQNNNGKAAP